MRDSEQRRRFLRTTAFAAAAFSTPGLFAEELTRTANQAEGPFYPDKLPLDTDNDLLLLNDSISPAVGEVTHLTGRILDLSGNPIRNAVVEIWQADQTGAYIHTKGRKEKMDRNFQGFARFLTGSTGEYYFRCIKPTKYVGRAPHIHYAIYQNGKRMLTTQLYVKGDPQNEKDFLFREAKTPEAKATLVTDFTPIPQSKTGELVAKWDVVLGMTPEDPDVTDRGRGFGPPRD
jgi:protocatechuate 3,4-dioxygenase beta subunit